MLIGYARVSTNEQSTAVQMAAFDRHKVTTVYEEKQSSIKRRPVLEHVIDHVLKPGDVLTVYKVDRLARSMLHFVSIFERLRARDVGFSSLTEPIDTRTPQGRMFLQMLGVFAEFEREIIRERCLAGQIAARARGQVWGRALEYTRLEAGMFADMWRSGWYRQRTLAEMFDVSESTMRDYIHYAENRGRWATRPRKK